MEQKFYNNNIEQLLKEKSDEFKMYPSKRVWYSIYNNLHPGRKWPSIAVSLLLITALFLIGYWNNNKNNNTTLAINTPVALNTAANFNTTKNNTTPAYTTSAGTKPMQQPLSLEHTKNNLPLNQKQEVSSSKKIYLQKTKISAPNYLPNNLKNTPSALSTEEDITTIAPKNIAENNALMDGELNNIAPIINNTALAQKVKTDEEIKNATPLENTATPDDKIVIGEYANKDKSKHKKWKDRTAIEFYITPSINYRTLKNDSRYSNLSAANTALIASASTAIVNNQVSQKPGIGFEVGLGISHKLSKKLLLKTGLQANYTSYSINADKTNHPVLTNLLLVDANTNSTYLQSYSSNLDNSHNLQPTTVHNNTYQLSLPIGLAFKLYTKNKIDWYVGSTLQPTYVFGGTAYLISGDMKNYVADASFIRQWNLNSSLETFINYKLNKVSFQAGPQFRYQLASTYKNTYTVKENNYSVGLKIGVVKNF